MFLFDLLGLALAWIVLAPIAVLILWWTAAHFSWWWLVFGALLIGGDILLRLDRRNAGR